MNRRLWWFSVCVWGSAGARTHTQKELLRLLSRVPHTQLKGLHIQRHMKPIAPLASGEESVWAK